MDQQNPVTPFILPSAASQALLLADAAFPKRVSYTRGTWQCATGISHVCCYPPICPVISLPVYIFVPQGVFLL